MIAFLKPQQLAEISGKTPHTSTLCVMSTTGTPHPIDGHDKHSATVTLFLAPSNCASSASAGSTQDTKSTGSPALKINSKESSKDRSNAAHQVQQTNSSASAQDSNQPSAPALARTLSSASSSSASSHSTSAVLLGKDVAAKVGMRVEMKEPALAKARGAGVITNVCTHCEKLTVCKCVVWGT